MMPCTSRSFFLLSRSIMDAIDSRCSFFSFFFCLALFFFFNMPLSPNLSSSHLKLLISLFCSSAFFLPPLPPLFLCYLLLHSCSSYLWCSQLLNFAFGFLAHFRSLAMLNVSFMWNLWKKIHFPNLKLHVCHFLFLFASCCFDRRWSWVLGFDVLHHIVGWCDARDVFFQPSKLTKLLPPTPFDITT